MSPAAVDELFNFSCWSIGLGSVLGEIDLARTNFFRADIRPKKTANDEQNV
jgi:hypothetical protein